MPAEQHIRQARRVVAAEDEEVLAHAAHEIGHALDARGGLLDAGDIGHLRKPQDGVVREIGDRARRHVVKQDRDVARLGDRLEVAVEAFLRRLVVVRHHRERVRGARLLGELRELDRFARGIAAGARDHRHPSLRRGEGRFDEAAVLVDVDGRRLAGRADDDDPRSAILNVEIDQPAQRGQIERSAATHRRRDRDETAGQHGS